MVKNAFILMLLLPPALGAVTVHLGFSEAEWVGKDLSRLGYDRLFSRAGVYAALSHEIALLDKLGLQVGVSHISLGFRGYPTIPEGGQRFLLGYNYGVNIDYVGFFALLKPTYRVPHIGALYLLAGPKVAVRRSYYELEPHGELLPGRTEEIPLLDPRLTLGAGVKLDIRRGIKLYTGVALTQSLRSAMKPSVSIRNRNLALKIGVGPLLLGDY